MKPKQNKKTIGIVLTSVPGYSETFFRNKIKGLQDHGFEVILFVDYFKSSDAKFPCTVVGNADFDAGGFNVVWIGIKILIKTLFFHLKASIRLFKLERKDGVSVIKSLQNLVLYEYLLNQKLDWLHFGFGMLANNREHIAEAINAKMAVSFRGFDLYLSPLKHPGCYDRLFKKEVRYHVLSNEMKATLIGYNIKPQTIQIITPAIDIDFFKQQPVKRDNKVLELITVARLHWKKGLEYTLQALSILHKKGIQFNYTIIGDGEEKERLLFAAHQMGIMNSVTFLGQQDQAEIKKHLTNSHIYLQYSIQEGFCNAVLEAQAMGLLCIVSNAEGLAENVLHEKTGWVVPKRNPKALAQKIDTVMNLSEAEKHGYIGVAKARIERDFNLEQQNLKFKNFYTSD